MKYLFGVSIGPVQGFIAAARKVRDLYVGSWILSELAKSVALGFDEGGRIFPAATQQQLMSEEFAAVNKIIGVVSHEQPGELAKQLRQRAENRLQEFVREAFGEIGGRAKIDRGLAERQVRCLLEFHCAWVALPAEEDYPARRARLDALLAGNKALNRFPAYRGEPGRRKCTIDGRWETVILDRGRIDTVRVRENEDLDGPSLVKRFLGRRVRFDSTFEAAATPYVRQLERMAAIDVRSAEILSDLRRLNEMARLHPDSGQLLFERESGGVFEKDSDADNELRALLDRVAERGYQLDAPYYALMIADGDSMGERISEIQTIEEHRTLSRELAAFAAAVTNRLKELDCMPIFAGGDDVMAVIPLHRLRSAAWEVRRMFRSVGGEYPPTMSAGIAIVSAQEPLDEAKEVARRAERKAKQQEGKDSVAIIVRPRSGAEVETVGKWEDDDRDRPSMRSRLADIVKGLRQDRLSFGFAHELRELVTTTPPHPDLAAVMPQMAVALARKKKKSDPTAQGLVEALADAEDLKHLIDCLLVARKIAKAETAAGEPLYDASTTD